MKKGFCILAALLIFLASLTGLAAPDNPAAVTVMEVADGDTMGTNYGTVVTNNGTITVNSGTVITNNKTVEKNRNTVENNYGTVIQDSAAAIVESNYGAVEHGKKDADGAIGYAEDGSTLYGVTYANADQTADTRTFYFNESLSGGTTATVKTPAELGITVDSGVLLHFRMGNGTVVAPGDTFTVTGPVWLVPVAYYAVTVQNDGHGTAGSSLSSAAEGNQITLTATPKSGYAFKEWQVVSGGITVSDNKFTMPGGAVTVKAVFEATAPKTGDSQPLAMLAMLLLLSTAGLFTLAAAKRKQTGSKGE